MGNKEFWDMKFKERSNNPLNPEKTLVDNIGYFKKGSVLDIACGDGRNSLFLSSQGFKVTGVDFSNEALKRLKSFADRKNYDIQTCQIDLSHPTALRRIGKFDNVLINHYRLNSDQVSELVHHIKQNGILFICGFGHKHKSDERIRENDLIRKKDFEELNKYFELMKYLESKDNRGFFVTYIYRRK